MHLSYLLPLFYLFDQKSFADDNFSSFQISLLTAASHDTKKREVFAIVLAWVYEMTRPIFEKKRVELDNDYAISI